MIIINSIKCRKCGDVLVSQHTHDFVRCSCPQDFVAADGGNDYLRRVGTDYIELSTLEVDASLLWNIIGLLKQCEKMLNYIPNSYIPVIDKKSYDVVKDISELLKKLP